MAIDIQYAEIHPELPDVIEREQFTLYVPIAAADGSSPGIIAIDTDLFSIVDGKLVSHFATTDEGDNQHFGVAKFDADYFDIENGVVTLKSGISITDLTVTNLVATNIELDGDDLVTILQSKLSKVITGGSNRLYAVDANGEQYMANVASRGTAAYTVVGRDENGHILVEYTPTRDNEATRKKYVDDQDDAHLAEAKSDATSKANAAESNANTYTDNKVGGYIQPSRVKTQRLEIGAMDVKPSIEALQANDEDQDTAIAGKISSTEKGAAGGVASLDSTGKVPSSQLPSYVDDVVEYDTFSDFPAIGESGRIYVAKDTNFTYRWSGTQYTQIGGGVGGGRWTYVGDEDEHTVPSELSIGGIFYERM